MIELKVGDMIGPGANTGVRFDFKTGLCPFCNSKTHMSSEVYGKDSDGYDRRQSIATANCKFKVSYTGYGMWKLISLCEGKITNKEVYETLNTSDLTPRKLIEALQKIPEAYQDDSIHVSGITCDEISIAMVVDDAEEARAKWRAGDPDYVLFMFMKTES